MLSRAIEEIINKERLADEKSSEVKKKKEEKAAAVEHRQSAMERLGQTVKRHFEHFIRIPFLYMRNSSFTATLEFSCRERRSRPSPFTVHFVVVDA